MTDLSDSNKCIVFGCKNHKNEGRFIGKVCGPCNDMLVSGEPKYGQTFVHEMKARIKELERELSHCIYEIERDGSRKPHRVRRAAFARETLKGEET